MTLFNPIIRPGQAQAARVLVQVTPDYLSQKSGFDLALLRDFEAGRVELDADQQEKLRAALEDLGAVFLPEDEEFGHGVRLKFNSRKAHSIRTWEGEGGAAQPDVV